MYPRGEISLWGIDRCPLVDQLLLYDHLTPKPISRDTLQKQFLPKSKLLKNLKMHNFFQNKDRELSLASFDSSRRVLQNEIYLEVLFSKSDEIRFQTNFLGGLFSWFSGHSISSYGDPKKIY